MEKYSFKKTYYISVKSGILWYLSHKFDWLDSPRAPPATPSEVFY